MFWQDILYFSLFALVYFFYVGSFRNMMAYGNWTKSQVILFKALIMLSSTAYIIEGFMFIYEKDKLSDILSSEQDSIRSIINNESFSSQTTSDKRFYNDYLNSLEDYVSLIKDLMLLYVFTNFAFIF
jgi:hypothetical protein